MQNRDIKSRWDSLTKPRGSLGKLEDAVVQLGAIQGTSAPRIERRGMYVFCGDHGVTCEGVSLYPSVVTREMVKNFLAGGAAINVLCRHFSIEPVIVDCGVCGGPVPGAVDRRIAEGTRNLARGPAMTEAEAALAVGNGIALAEEAASKFDIVGVGEMGIGNSTAASALLCALTEVAPEDAVGRGTGLDHAGVAHKRAVVEMALARSKAGGALVEYGGFEIATMAGFLLGAFGRGLPVVVDGFIGGAAFLAARAMRPEIGQGCIFAHRSAEKGHAALLTACGIEPLLDLGMRLGEGTGAAMAIGVIASAVALYREMATFEQASVSPSVSEQKV